jgi:hypothetical protein
MALIGAVVLPIGRAAVRRVVFGPGLATDVAAIERVIGQQLFYFSPILDSLAMGRMLHIASAKVAAGYQKRAKRQRDQPGVAGFGRAARILVH